MNLQVEPVQKERIVVYVNTPYRRGQKGTVPLKSKATGKEKDHKVYVYGFPACDKLEVRCDDSCSRGLVSMAHHDRPFVIDAAAFTPTPAKAQYAILYQDVKEIEPALATPELSFGSLGRHTQPRSVSDDFSWHL